MAKAAPSRYPCGAQSPDTNALRPPDHHARLTLVLGGARSGKSRAAEALAEASDGRLIYCATATDWGDLEMAARIADHRDRRGPRWTTREAPLDLAAMLAAEARPDAVVVVDCLTLWLTNVMLAEHDVAAATAALAAELARLRGPVVLVSNEVGSGIVPDNALARRFRDAQGRLNQAMAQACDTVLLVVAGLPLLVKPDPGPRVVLGQVSTRPVDAPEPGEAAAPCGSAR